MKTRYDKAFPGPVYMGPCEQTNCGKEGYNCNEMGRVCYRLPKYVIYLP